MLKQLLGLGLDDMVISKAREILLPEQISTLLGDRATGLLAAFLSGITLVLWKSGVQIVIFLSGLQGISGSLYEAARCDSATEWDIFWKVTLPMMSPIIFLNIVYTIVDMFSDSGNEMINYFVNTAFVKNQIPYASALSWIYFLFIAALLILVFSVMGRIVRKTVG